MKDELVSSPVALEQLGERAVALLKSLEQDGPVERLEDRILAIQRKQGKC